MTVLRLRIPFIRALKTRVREALGIKPNLRSRRRRKKKFRPVPGVGAVALRDIDPRSIAFRSPAARPVVSVIIPGYGEVDHTLNCLASIADHPPKFDIEILVVEDASGDPDMARLREVRGIRLIENPVNLGFLRSCNAAAATAQGEFLHFLNNDTILETGAIDALVAFLREHSDAGMVGSRLLFPNGQLQEAGGIVWNDASAWNYGRGDDPRKPEYQYAREADYISGASILLSNALWRSLGGFDEIYAPAYYEDTDLAFRVRQAGKKVYFVPASTVYHFEGVSHGTDTTKGVKAYQVVNREIFVNRWRDELTREHFPNAQHVMRARDRAGARKVLLMLDHYVPQPDRDAGSRVMVEFIRRFQEAGWIVKFWPENLHYDPVYTPQLQNMGVEVIYGPFVHKLAEWLDEHGGDVDAALVSRPRVAQATLPTLKKMTKVPILYFGHDLHFARQRLDGEVKNDRQTIEGANKMEMIERSVWRSVDVALYPSEEEARVVRALEPGVPALAVSPYYFEHIVFRDRATAGKSIVFVAGFSHSPNVDAAQWLVRSILPLVRRRHPDARLSLVGSNPTDEVRALAGENIEVTGWVSSEELAARYAAARVAVVPLRIGAGVKLKLVEALASGVPVVTTPIGVQGLEDFDAPAGVSDAPEDIAEAISRWLEADDKEWLDVAHRQAGYVETHFGTQKMSDDLFRALRLAEDSRRAAAV